MATCPKDPQHRCLESEEGRVGGEQAPGVRARGGQQPRPNLAAGMLEVKSQTARGEATPLEWRTKKQGKK